VARVPERGGRAVSRGPVTTVAWGSDGLRLAVERGDIPVIVDVLRFSSTVTTAVANGFTILPAPTREAARALAAVAGAEVSGPRGTARWSLSPLDYVNPREPEEVILVSPNGAALANSLPPGTPGFIACLLNARTAGRLLGDISRDRGTGVVLVPAGEAVEDQETDLEHRRFAVEDYLGCGAVLSELKTELDAEASACREAFLAAKSGLAGIIRDSPSGRYLVDRGHAADLSHCVQLSIYEVLPVVRDGRIAAWAPDGAGRRD
jgi:2-phosphosulfolactate phosphatase